jgi:hypothetical protein
MHGESVRVGLTMCPLGRRGATLRIGSRMTAGFGSMAVLLAITCGLGWILASQQIGTTSSERLALATMHDIKQYQLDAAGVAVAATPSPTTSRPTATRRQIYRASIRASAQLGRIAQA